MSEIRHLEHFFSGQTLHVLKLQKNNLVRQLSLKLLLTVEEYSKNGLSGPCLIIQLSPLSLLVDAGVVEGLK